MTTLPTDSPLGPAPTPGRGPEIVAGRIGGGTWSLSPRGIGTVARLELRQRVRTNRWYIVLFVWMAVLGFLTLLIRTAILGTYGRFDDSLGGLDLATQAERQAQAGRVVFGIIVFLVLSLGALVAPALSATSVNGDRQNGVLATLQTTLLSPAEIVIGKLLAAWVVALALLAAASPFIVWAYFDGGTPLLRVLVVLGVLALTLLVVCAIGLGWSAVAARTSSSSVLTYLTVAMLGLGLPLLFALSVPLVTQREPVQVRNAQSTNSDGSTFTCTTETVEMERAHTERSWWLLAASPYVVVADSAPRPTTTTSQDDPLTGLGILVREVRLGPAAVEDWCGQPSAEVEADQAARDRARNALSPVWPYGLAANLALAGVFVVVAVRRLVAPARRLARGTRVA